MLVLTSCRGCGRTALSDAKFCSNCGRNLKSTRASGTTKKVGMILTMLGGFLFFFPAVLAVLGLIWGIIAGSVVQDSVGLVVQGSAGQATDPFITIATLVALFVASLQIIVSGAFVSSDRPSYRKQGGALALAAGGIAYLAVLAFPFIGAYFEISSVILQLTFVSTVFVFLIEFAGLILTTLGATLGITYRGLLEGIRV